MLIWQYGIEMGLTYIMLNYAIINVLGMRKLYLETATGDIDALFEVMWNETTTTIASQAFTFAILYTNKPSWEDAQLNAIKASADGATPEENQEEPGPRGPDAEQGELSELMVNF